VAYAPELEIPQVTTSFAALGVPEQLCAALTRRGMDEPFPIQAATVPDALAGRDIAGRAPTGSGKTLAFGLAVAAQALRAGKPQSRRPRALVLVPTRELAAQVQRELQALVPRSAGPVVSVYGGVGYGPQRKALAIGASAVVACPGRLEDLVGTNDVFLDAAELVVLDEADRMADMGFMPAVKRLLDRTPADRQTLLFSATLDGDVDALVKRYQNDPARHEVVTDEADAGDVSHLFWRLPRADRSQVTAQVVDRLGPTVVFCRTCHGADRVAKQLAREGVPAVAIHGRRSQGQRSRALAQFTAGKAPALVATDVAARGIHVDGVACVVHFDMPEDAKDWVHRSGRTGRAGADGLVVSLVPTEEGDRKTRQLQRQLDRPEPIEDVDLDRLAGIAAGIAPPSTPIRATGPVTLDDDGDAPLERALAGSRPDHARHDRGDERGRGPRRRSRDRRADRTSDQGRPSVPAGATGATVTAERPERPGPGRTERSGDRRDRSDRGDRSGRREDARQGPARGAKGPRAEAGRNGDSASGTVTVFHADRGYGFIARRGGGDVFVHASNTGGKALAAGQRVRFEVAPGRRGSQAVNVRPA
jgi:superfamily II DNA/RNA helicase/cold shock CspA family protein